MVTLLASEVLEPVLLLFLLKIQEHFIHVLVISTLIIHDITALDSIEHAHTPHSLPKYAFQSLSRPAVKSRRLAGADVGKAQHLPSGTSGRGHLQLHFLL